MGVQEVIIACDFDDTLTYTRWKYTAAKLKCAEIIVRALGGRAPYDPQQLMDELFVRNQRIDSRLMREQGLSPSRFPQSWVETYREICKEKGAEFDPDVAKKVERAASAFRRGPFRATPEAIEALRELQAAGCELHLVTAGEKTLQRRKIRDSGLAPFFEDRIHIVDMDKRPVLQELADSGSKQVFMVGDSLRADVGPALDVGVRAVWIPVHGHWHGDDADVDMSKVERLRSIRDLPRFIRKLVGDGGKRKRAGKSRAKGKDAKREATA